MYVAMTTNFVVDKKQSAGELLDRLHGAVSLAEGGAPSTQFLFLDRPGSKVSAVRRAIDRIPPLGAFEACEKEIRSLSNRPESPAAGRQIDFANLRDIVASVPRSLPFEGYVISFRVSGLGPAMGPPVGGPAISVSFSGGGVLGASSLDVRALRVVEASPADERLAQPPPAMVSLLATCGKPKSMQQRVFSLAPASPTDGRLVARFAAPSAGVASALSEFVGAYRAHLDNVVARAHLPHDLAPPDAAAPTAALTRPRKAELARAFAPLGYDCDAGAGNFVLRRRTQSHLTVEIHLDVGTWSRSLTGAFIVYGMGFVEQLPLPVSSAAWGGGQYPIDGPRQWRQIVENLAAVAAEYDRSFVPALEAICGPTPAWFMAEK